MKMYRLDGQRPGRHRPSDLHLRRDEGRRGRRARAGQADRDPFLWPGRGAGRGAGGRRFRRARDGHGRRHAGGDGRAGTFYVPTVDHNRYYADNATIRLRRAVVERLEAFIRRTSRPPRRAVKAGVQIAMGSDAVFTGFGENTRELGGS